MTFEEYEAIVTQVPASLRNNLDRTNLPVRGLQEEAGKIGTMLQAATASGRLALTAEQQADLRDRLADALWYVALLAKESGTSIAQIASHSVDQVKERFSGLDPDQR